MLVNLKYFGGLNLDVVNLVHDLHLIMQFAKNVVNYSNISTFLQILEPIYNSIKTFLRSSSIEDEFNLNIGMLCNNFSFLFTNTCANHNKKLFSSDNKQISILMDSDIVKVFVCQF